MSSGFTFTVTTADAPAAVRDRLVAALTAPHPLRLSEPTSFYGEVWDGGFWVTRNLVLFESSITCVARGKIEPAGDGSVVTVSTRLPWPLILFGLAWSAFWGRLIVERFTTDPLPGGTNWGEIAFLACMTAGVWVMLFAVTTTEERRFQKALTPILADTGPTSRVVGPVRPKQRP